MDLRGRAGFVHGLLLRAGLHAAADALDHVIGPDAWVALGLLEALFYGLMGVGWAWLAAAALVAASRSR